MVTAELYDVFGDDNRFEVIATPARDTVTVMRQANQWLTDNEVTSHGQRVRAQPTTLRTPSGREVLVFQPPVDKETARKLGQHLCNKLNGHVRLTATISPTSFTVAESTPVINTEILTPQYSDGTPVTALQPGYVDYSFLEFAESDQ